MAFNPLNPGASLVDFANKMKNKLATSVGAVAPKVGQAAKVTQAITSPVQSLLSATANKVGTAVGNAAANKVGQVMQQPIVGVPGTAQRAPVVNQQGTPPPTDAQLAAVRAVKSPVQAPISPKVAPKPVTTPVAPLTPVAAPTTQPRATERATLVSPSGERVDVPVGSAVAQGYFKQGYKLENKNAAPVNTAAIPENTQSPTATVAPNVPEVPAVNSEMAAPSDLEKQREALRQSLLGATTLSADEQRAKSELDRLNEEANAAIYGVDTEGSQRGFTTGYATGLKGAFAKAADVAKLPLEARIANLQAQREAQQKADATKLGFIQSDIEAERAAKKEAAGLSREDAATKRTILLQALQGGATQQQMAAILAAKTPEEAIQIAGSLLAPKKKADLLTVGENQTVIDPNTGKVVFQGAGAGMGGDNELNKLLSPTEAQALGVPYGTTRGQAFGQVPGAGQQSLTAEQSKARQFAVDAENANNVLGTLGYDPGLIEPPLPNQLKSSARQQFEQAARAFVNATLRRESGATITDAEYENKYKQLIPQAGDADAVKQQKAAARQAAVQSIQQAGLIDQGQNDPLGLFSSAPSTALNGSIQIGSRLGKINNNPGNLRFAGQAGASQGEGGFARFSSPEAGYQALKNQIQLDASRGLTLGQFIYKYAPPTENDTNLYAQQMAQATGANLNTPVRNINLDALARAMAQKESLTRFA